MATVMAAQSPSMPPRRNPPLPRLDARLDAPRGSSRGCSAPRAPPRDARSSLASTKTWWSGPSDSVGAYPAAQRSGASTPVDSKAGICSSTASRSTSASSYRRGSASGADGSATAASAGDLLATLATSAECSSPQTEAVVKAMLPIVKRAMVSQNKAVFQASLESMQRIARVFGQDAIDQLVETLAEALEKQQKREGGPLPGADARTNRVLQTLTALCSKETASSLRRRFPKFEAQ